MHIRFGDKMSFPDPGSISGFNILVDHERFLLQFQDLERILLATSLVDSDAAGLVGDDEHLITDEFLTYLEEGASVDDSEFSQFGDGEVRSYGPACYAFVVDFISVRLDSRYRRLCCEIWGREGESSARGREGARNEWNQSG